MNNISCYGDVLSKLRLKALRPFLDLVSWDAPVISIIQLHSRGAQYAESQTPCIIQAAGIAYLSKLDNFG